MSHQEQINAFSKDIEAVIERYRREFELTVAAAVGVLELAKLDLWNAERPKGDDE